MAGFWSSTFGGGNSFGESVANTFTPGDGYSYERGELVNDSTGRVMTQAERTAAGVGSADNLSTNRAAYESRPNVPEAKENSDGSSTDRPVTGLRSLAPFIGGAMLGPIGVAGGLAYRNSNLRFGSNPNNIPTIEPKKPFDPNNYPTTGPVTGPINRRPVYTDAQIKEMHRTGKIKTPEGRIQGSFFKNEGDQDDPNAPMYKMNRFGNTYRVDRTGQNYGNSSLIAEQAAAAGGEGGIAAVRPVGTQATVPTDGLPAISAMSEAAASGAFMPIPDPNYDPNDPMSSKYIINPTYDQIAEYQKSILGMAEGGEVESALGGNEKDLINDAEKAIRGELDETRAAIILAQYVQQYGEDALRDLVNSVRTGSAQETRDRFARGDNGYVNGNGDGSGTDDKVPAKLKEGDSEQDVLLATKEFVFKESAATALDNAGISLDKINDAGTNAPKVLKEYFTE